MTIDVALTPAEIINKQPLNNSIVVVVDVLRASATMCSILSRGAKEIVLFESIKAATDFHNANPGINVVLAGEQGGLPPEGFDFGNSPTEILQQNLLNKTVRYTTTNGTRMLNSTVSASLQIVASFVNLDAVCSFIYSRIQTDSSINQVLVCCSGNSGGFSLEDSFFAGRFVSRYIAHSSSYELTDAAKAAICIANSYTNNINDLIRDSHHAQLLIEYGFGDDVTLCLKDNVFDIVPICHNGIVTL